MTTLSTRLKLARAIERSKKRLHLAPASRFTLLNRYRHLLDIDRGINLPAAIDFFTRHPSPQIPLATLQAQQDTAQAHLRELIAGVDAAASKQHAIPKVIWMFWNSGLEQAPEVVRLAHQSWKAMNPDYEVRFLDDVTVRHYLEPEKLQPIASLELTLAHKSDLIRTYLLARYGGVWADSTTFCWQPLSSWLDAETRETGFFMFRQPQSRKDRQITNWFIAAAPGNAIIRQLFLALCDYIFKPRPVTLWMKKPRHYHKLDGISRTGTGYPLLEALEQRGGYPYFFYHYLFNEVVAEGEAGELWQKAITGRNEHAKNEGEIGSALVSKQTHKGDYPQSETFRNRKQQVQQLIAKQPQGTES